MFEELRKSIDRFSEGFSLTDSERKALEEAERKNAENEQAITQGYSVGCRKFLTPEIPDLLDRIRRGFQNVFTSERDSDSAKGPR